MNKLVLAAAALALVGGAAFAVVHVKSSLCDGVCPLTGEPMCDRASPKSAPAATSLVAAPAAVSAAPAAYAAPANESRCTPKPECPSAAKDCAAEEMCDPADCAPEDCTPEERAACAKKKAACKTASKCDSAPKTDGASSKP
jgi:hypothetical protein